MKMILHYSTCFMLAQSSDAILKLSGCPPIIMCVSLCYKRLVHDLPPIDCGDKSRCKNDLHSIKKYHS